MWSRVLRRAPRTGNAVFSYLVLGVMGLELTLLAAVKLVLDPSHMLTPTVPHLSYTLGSSEKQIVPQDKELFSLESRVEIEKSIKQVILL